MSRRSVFVTALVQFCSSIKRMKSSNLQKRLFNKTRIALFPDSDIFILHLVTYKYEITLYSTILHLEHVAQE